MNTLVQLLAFGSSSSTVVICFRKSDSCIPGWDPRRLNTAFGLDKMTWRLTANPLWKVKKKNFKIKYWCTSLFFCKISDTSEIFLNTKYVSGLGSPSWIRRNMHHNLKRKTDHYDVVHSVSWQRCICEAGVGGATLLIGCSFIEVITPQHSTLGIKN